MNSLLKWAGGKKWLAPRIKALWDGETVVSLFAGGLSEAFDSEFPVVRANDSNSHLFRFYQVLRRGALHFYPEFEFSDYYWIRDDYNKIEPIVRVGTVQEFQDEATVKASQFYWLNKHCFNGLWRVGPNGFNVSVGKQGDKLRVETAFDQAPYVKLMQDWTFSQTDFARVSYASGDFIYADPPYTGGYTGFTREGWDVDDDLRLFYTLKKHRGTVVVSGAYSDQLTALYASAGFTVESVTARRRIACNGNREDAVEMFAYRKHK